MLKQIKTNKTKINTNIQEYHDTLCNRIFSKIIPTKQTKIDDRLGFRIPNFNEFELLVKCNYNINQLKTIAKHYEIKMVGNKSNMSSQIYSYLYLSSFAVKLQKYCRGHLFRKYMRFHGPALKQRSLCTNNIDFLSMEQLSDISKEQFFSYKDEDGFIYGFDILSLYNLIYKCDDNVVKNPFNIKPIGQYVIDDFRTLLRLSKLFKINLVIEIADISKEVSNKKRIELQTLTLFQNIDALGNYSNAEWFLTLDRLRLLKFTRELVDIWTYRAHITNETKRAICPPIGNPFSRLPKYHILQNIENIDDIRSHLLGTLERLIGSGIDKDSKCMGAYYILGALTLVNVDAATTMPWLYQAVCYM